MDRNDSGIIEKIGYPAACEQLAEECCELAHAALKLSRAMRGTNPTPVSIQEAKDNMEEEYADVVLCASLIGLNLDQDTMTLKWKRWRKRLGLDVREDM
jgi:NTP pyrophosphatase (non-canonical NTP hydrolase)